VTSRARVLLVILVVLFAGMLLVAGAMRMRGTSSPVTARRVLTLDVPARLEEDEPEVDFFSPGSWRRSRLTLFDLLETLHRAAGDPQVRALVLHIDSIDWGWAKVAEVRAALQEFRQAHKPVYAALEGGGEPEFFLASGADRIAMPVASDLQLNGLTASALFLRGTFDKLGVRPNFMHVGKYKSAVESYTRTDLSEPAREALGAVLGDTYRFVADTLAYARRSVPDSIRAWMDRGPYSSEEARAIGLIDTLLDGAEVDSLAMHRARGAALSRLTTYADRGLGGHVLPRIALVTATGTITGGKSRIAGGERMLGSETLIEALRRARTRSHIRAIVLRIDSPGGDATASDEIWHEVVRCRRVKPVIVSMSDVAASGGYYIAAGADTLVADPATITGSIGIFGGKFNIRGLYEKLGLGIETMSTGPHAEMYSPFRDFTEDEARLYQDHLQKSYERFLERVAVGRRRPTAWVDSVGQGRIWSGTAAVDLGLVDEIGGLKSALAIARARAGIEDGDEFEVERLPSPEEGYLARFLRDFWNPEDEGLFERAATLANPLFDPLKVLGQAAAFGNGAALAIMPYTIVIR
jgi:protease-4